MTAVDVCGLGLIAGLSYTDIQNTLPGFIVDLFIVRRDYDDAQHGIKRE